ncbi:hypothetical protein BGZ54_007944 [Gamsiella multidivaricata]|nr:hypothetical protein BGZ54_007944 [Gamsiella multidivaricata]
MTNFRRKDKDLLERHVPKCGGKIGGEGSTLRSDGEPLDWKELAREVFGYRFTPEQLQFKHIQLLTERRRWTRKQEMTLIDLIMQQRVSRDGLDEQVWHEAAQHLKFHSPEDCKNRWQQLQGYLIRKYQISKAGHHWAEGEILAYWASWRRYGNDWDRIAEAVRLTRQGNISTGTNSVPYQDHSSSSLKTPKDCRDDFQFLVALSVSRGDHLEKVLGKLAHNISGRPRSHHWTKEQLDRLKGAASLEYKPCQTSPSDADIDWMAVAKRVGGGVTESQCQYRWATYQSPSTAPGMTRVGRWDQTEVLALQRALHDLHLLGSTYQLPPRFPKFVQQEYSLQRKASAIRTKAKKLLERHVLRYQEDDIRRGMKALISLQDIARAEGNSTPNKHSGHLNTSLRTESDLVGPRSFQEDGDVGALSESLSTDKIMYSDDDPDDDSDLGTVHPTMFVAPGILKTEVPRNVSTSGSKRQRRVVFTWQTGDVEKLERLVKKYGQSSLGWRQIAQEMSIPVLKCKDKWRRSFGDTLYE